MDASSAVTLRQGQTDDLPEIAEMSRRMWFGDEMAGSHEASNLVGINDTAHLASEATYARVAVLDGAVCGVLMARVKGESTLGLVSTADFEQSYAAIAKAPDGPHIEQYLREDRADVERLAHATDEHSDAEILLFIMAPQARGHHVGSLLFDEFLTHLLDSGADSYYLYTDSACNYGYYDHRGMRRVATHLGAPALEGGTYDKFIYAGSAYENLAYKASPTWSTSRKSFTKSEHREGEKNSKDGWGVRV
jgi:ribosomal protein S18 acetylase RimI-like enzyme